MPRRAPTVRSPTVLVFDSGLGGLTVLAELVRAMPGIRFVYAADDAAFPYGRLGEAVLVERVVAVMERLIAEHRPDLVVVACNTASTIVLPALRKRFPLPFVGTVPAIKPAAALTRTRHIAVLATPGTVARDYTRALIDAYAGELAVTLVGSPRLAGLAEAALRGDGVDEDAVRAELAPCFTERDGRRTDVVVLACTHFPLLLPVFESVAPWPVAWVDPAAAIARQAARLLGPLPQSASAPDAVAVFTGTEPPSEALRAALATRGLGRIAQEPMPLTRH